MSISAIGSASALSYQPALPAATDEATESAAVKLKEALAGTDQSGGAAAPAATGSSNSGHLVDITA